MELELIFVLILIVSFVFTLCALLGRLRKGLELEDCVRPFISVARMSWGAIIVLLLIVAFLIYFCGLAWKQARARANRVSHTDIFIHRRAYDNRAREPSMDEAAGGVFPTNLAPPPYDYMEPPPKYEDVIKINITEIPAAVHQTTTTDTGRPPAY